MNTIFVLDKISKSVEPIIDNIVIIESNINKEPNNVYKKKENPALTLSFEPNNPINALSKSNIIIINIPLFIFILFQLESIDIGIIKVVNNTKYIDNPSIPIYMSN